MKWADIFWGCLYCILPVITRVCTRNGVYITLFFLLWLDFDFPKQFFFRYNYFLPIRFLKASRSIFYLLSSHVFAVSYLISIHVQIAKNIPDARNPREDDKRNADLES